jgi:hypothetical protein
MASAKQAKSAIPYIQRLFEDEYVQEQLRNAASGLWVAYQRARRGRIEAIEDRRLYGSLRQAATSIRKVVTRVQQPKPQPKRRLRKVATVALAAGGTALLVTKLQKSQTGNQSSSSEGAVDAEAARNESSPTAEPRPATVKATSD